MLTLSERNILLYILLQIKHKPILKSAICSNIRKYGNPFYRSYYVHNMLRWCKDTWRYWPEFSGDIVYPITEFNKGVNIEGYSAPQYEYMSCLKSACAFWKGKQGELRKDLIDYLIYQLAETNE